MLQPSPLNVEYTLVDRDKLLALLNTAKIKQQNTQPDYDERKQVYLADMMKQLEALPYRISGDDVWLNSDDDGTLLIRLIPNVPKPSVSLDWEHWEKMVGMEVRPAVPVNSKVLALLLKYTKENEDE